MEYLEKNKNITELSNYKTPAKAQYFFELKTEEDIGKLFRVIQWAKKEDIQTLFVSGGTNMLFGFDEYRGVVIKNSLK